MTSQTVILIFTLLLVPQLQAYRVTATFMEDVADAKISTQSLLNNTDILIVEEESFLTVLSNDVLPILQQILIKFENFGIAQAELDSLQTHILISYNHTFELMRSQISVVYEFKTVVLNIEEHLDNGNFAYIESDIAALLSAQQLVHESFIDTTFYITKDIMSVREHIFNLTSDLSLEQATDIRSDVDEAQQLINTQFMNIVEAKAFLDAGVVNLIAKLEQVAIQLPKIIDLIKNIAKNN